MQQRPKIWIGIGLVLSLPIEVVSAETPTGANPTAQTTAQAPGADRPRSAVGGESYLRDGGISDTRTRFSRDMLLLLGHLHVAAEAVDAGQWDVAKGHLTTSSEDIRAKLEPYMRGQGVASFDKVVAALTKAIEAKDKRAFAAARAAFEAHAERGSLAIKKFQTPYLRFQVRAIVETMKAASSAYDSAVTGESISDAAEYRDSRGFMLAALRAFEQVEFDMAKTHPDHVRYIKKRTAELAAAWPGSTPPAAITMNAEGVALLVSQIEDDAAIFWQDK